MAKGYWIVRVDVHDPATYQNYTAANAAAFAKYQGHFLVRGGRYENPRGSSRQRNVVVEFPSYEAALACYHSPEYAHAMDVRGDSAELDIVIVDGYEGPQPAAPAAGATR